MEHQKILSLLNKANDPKFVTRKWNISNDQSNANYNVGNEILWNTEVLKSYLCDYNDTYSLVRSHITIIGHQATHIAFKDCTPFTNFITKIDGTTIDDAEDLDLVMPMYNLIEYSSTFSEKQEVYGFIPKMKQLILIILRTLIISNLSSMRLNY